MTKNYKEFKVWWLGAQIMCLEGVITTMLSSLSGSECADYELEMHKELTKLNKELRMYEEVVADE